MFIWNPVKQGCLKTMQSAPLEQDCTFICNPLEQECMLICNPLGQYYLFICTSGATGSSYKYLTVFCIYCFNIPFSIANFI